jgi:diguanylate cyclase (GGDEF)-like protein
MIRLAVERRDSGLDGVRWLPERGNRPRLQLPPADLELREAAHDGLTGAYLRAPGLRELRREIARAERTKQPLTVAFVDVSRLHAAGPSQVQSVGDTLLIAVAAALRSTVRAYDLIIRYSREEFVSVMSGQTIEMAAQRIELLNARLTGSLDLSSVTVGLAALRQADSSEAIVARADRALGLM